MVLTAALRAPVTHGTGVEEVTLSRESGLYDVPFYLEMNAGDGQIYYTLDASDPDENGILYTEPILIGDASANENVYSKIEDVALDLNGKLLTDAGFKLKFKYKVPQTPVDKATVVRAVRVDENGNRSQVANGVYFVGFDQKTGYDGMNVITITTDPKNLFDPDVGIYVLGKAFQKTLKDGAITLSSSKNYSFLPANYWYRGRNWEREASICFFDASGSLVLSGNYGIRIQGRAGSRPKLPKSLNLFAREEYGNPVIPAGDVLGLDVDLNRLNLNSGSNDVNSLLKDYLVNTFCSDMNFATREYVPYVMFLDGEYWGVYWLTPRYKKDYLTYKYQVLGDNLVVYYGYEAHSMKNARYSDNELSTKRGRIEVGQDEDMALYTAMRDFIVKNDMSNPINYARACEMIDIESCIDYYAVEIYIANTDWPKLNTALWRTRDVASGTYSDCKWRWLLFDVNAAMSESDAKLNCVKRTINRDELFASLMDSDSFSDALYRRLVKLAQDTFNPDGIDGFIDDYEAMMARQMQLKNQRFFNGEKAETYFIDACEKTRRFFRRRYDYIMGKYGDQYE